MKSISTFFIAVSFILTGSLFKTYGQGIAPYVTLWQTDNTGVTGITSIRIPASGEFTYSWEEDGNPSNSGSGSGNNTTDIDFPSSGKYKVTITPAGTNQFSRICFGCDPVTGGDREKLIDITAWGDVQWSSMIDAYRYCSNLTLTAADTPDLSGVSSLNHTFSGASNLIGTGLSGWDVSGVTDMKALFQYAFNNFNTDISG